MAHAKLVFVHALRPGGQILRKVGTGARPILRMQPLHPNGMQVVAALGIRKVFWPLPQHGEIFWAGPQVLGVWLPLPDPGIGNLGQNILQALKF